MKLKGNKIFVWFLVFAAAILFSGCGCKQKSVKQYDLQLEVWGLFDDSDVFDEIFETYTKINPNVSRVTYRKFTPETYEKDLIEALASGQGPDIFLISNTWLPKFLDKIYPAPEAVLNEQRFRNNFVDVVINDFLYQGKVFAVPLTVDSLGLYYNKDLFNAAGITTPPQNWDEFVADCQKLSKVSSDGVILQSAVAMGTAYNINRSTDVLGLLMLQNQTQMIDLNSGQAAFDRSVSRNGVTISPGEESLKFYTQFARSGGSNPYSWNPQMHYSIDAFAEGNLAMMFNYSWHRDTLAAKAPKLNFEVAPVPQLAGNPAVNYANYWGFTVAGNKKINKPNAANPALVPITAEIRVAESWKFLNYLTTRPEQSLSQVATVAGTKNTIAVDYDPTKNYLQKTRKPSGRKDLIEIQKSDPKIGVFARQNLIAKSWYQIDSVAIEIILAEMIDKINRGQAETRAALQAATVQISQLMR
jgi:ABC-type glycerol-3-phosphate transport system substrate-binding protein